MLLTPKNCKMLYGYVKTLHDNWNYMSRLRNELGLESRDSPNKQISFTKPQVFATNHSISKNQDFPSETDPLIIRTRSPMEIEVLPILPTARPVKLSTDTLDNISGSHVFISPTLIPTAPPLTIPFTNTRESTCQKPIMSPPPHLISIPFHNPERLTYPIPSFRLDLNDSLSTRIDPPLTYLCRLTDIIPSDKSVFRTKVIRCVEKL